MSSLDELAERFNRFENHQFPGFPDHPVLQEAYEELVEKNSALTAVIQRVLTGGAAAPDEIPSFDVDVSVAADDPDGPEFARYRREIDELVAVLRANIS